MTSAPFDFNWRWYTPAGWSVRAFDAIRTRRFQIGGVLVVVVAAIAAGVLLNGSSHQRSGGEGLLQSREAPPGWGGAFISLDRWVGNVGGRRYVVYAGAKVTPSREGAVRAELLVYSTQLDTQQAESPKLVGAYSPASAGRQPLRIVSAHGHLLDIQTSSGTHLSFNVADRAFSRIVAIPTGA